MTSRRDFLTGSSLALLGAAAPAGVWTAAGPGDALPAGGGAFVQAETTRGRVRGLQGDGIKIFRGIPYAASTGGPGRFLPPQPTSDWTGVRECVNYGPVCPQAPGVAGSGDGALHAGAVPAADMSEDCLNLNLWTPGLRDGARRPVLVTFPGSGFAAGSANAPACDGAWLARAVDVVVIGVNHRVGHLGYLQLADLGAPAPFGQAGVAGLMDLVAALEWVRDNAERFGGDPRNVTIFGHAGGGAKVSSLLATRAAQGLFHRAAVQSGSLLRFASREAATQRTAAVLKALRLSGARISDLQALPWQQLLGSPGTPLSAIGTRPVLDGLYLTHHPFALSAPDESAGVPLLVSTTLEDAALGLTNVDVREPQLRTIFDARFAGRGAQVLALYRRYYPDRSPFLIQAQAFTDAGRRRAALHQAELKALQGRGAIYLYEWDWAPPAEEGRHGALQGDDAAALWHDAAEHTDGTRLSRQLSSAFLTFAREGAPAIPKLPPWPGYDVTTRATLVFGTPTQMVNDHRGEIREFWQHMAPADNLEG